MGLTLDDGGGGGSGGGEKQGGRRRGDFHKKKWSLATSFPSLTNEKSCDDDGDVGNNVEQVVTVLCWLCALREDDDDEEGNISCAVTVFW